jgi:hypothetical protein
LNLQPVAGTSPSSWRVCRFATWAHFQVKHISHHPNFHSKRQIVHHPSLISSYKSATATLIKRGHCAASLINSDRRISPLIIPEEVLHLSSCQQQLLSSNVGTLPNLSSFLGRVYHSPISHHRNCSKSSLIKFQTELPDSLHGVQPLFWTPEGLLQGSRCVSLTLRDQLSKTDSLQAIPLALVPWIQDICHIP